MSDDLKVRMAARAALELNNGEVVNLGVGIPTLVADCLPEGLKVFFHTENGMLGVGPAPPPEAVNPNLVNASKMPVTETPGAAYFDSAASFAMIRGGHIDVAVLGALQVDQEGRVANWAVPGHTVLGVGGAMDLLGGARRVVVVMSLTDSAGRAKLVRQTDYPLTALRRVETVITELAVFQWSDSSGLTLTELWPGVSVAEVRGKTTAQFVVSVHLRPWQTAAQMAERHIKGRA